MLGADRSAQQSYAANLILLPGTIVVADADAFGGAGGLIAVNPQSGEQTVISSGGHFVDPTGLAMADDGTIYVADLGAFGGGGGLIAVDSTTGEQRILADPAPVFSRPMGVAVAPNHDVLVAYLDQGQIARVDPGNGAHHVIAPATEFFTPSDLTVDPQGRIVVAEADIQGFVSAIRRIETDGTVSQLTVNEPPGAIYFGVTFGPTGTLFAISNGNGPNNQRLARFALPDPTAFEVSANDKMKGIFGVAAEASGSVIVTDGSNGVLRVDTSTGTQTVVASGGHLAHPFGVIVVR